MEKLIYSWLAELQVTTDCHLKWGGGTLVGLSPVGSEAISR